ncbi:cation transporter [Aerococcaceae bacterium DSM 111176]|nr:cation transporter [Aerococcaceae bacterium DSM 111176]
MTQKYHMIGLRNDKQLNRIQRRFSDILGDSKDIVVDFDHSTIQLPKSIKPYTLSLISSFEQVTILPEELVHEMEQHHHEDDKHEHGHHHHHEHAVGDGAQAQRNMLIVFFLNLFFSLGEIIFGLLFNSQALISDAVHDFGDALSIGLAYLFERVSSRGSDEQFSFGYRRFSLLGAFVTSIVLIVGGAVIILTSIPVLLDPQPINHQGVFWVAIVAIAINGVSVWLMSRGSSANEKILNIHLLEDLVGWVAVLAMSIVLNFTDWYILDPILSIIIAAWILRMTLPEFIRISKLFLQAVPDNIDVQTLRERIQQLDHVQEISHFHIWSTDGEQHMMSMTVTSDLETSAAQEEIKQNIRRVVLAYDISHITIEVLYDPEQIINESIQCGG